MAPQIGDIFYGMTRSLSGKVTHPTIKFSDNVAPKSAPEAVQYWYSQTQRPLPSPAHGDIRWITHEDGSTS